MKEYGAGSTAVAAKAGKGEGTIEIAAFEKILKENPDSVHIIDVRDPKEFEAGHLKTRHQHSGQGASEAGQIPAGR